MRAQKSTWKEPHRTTRSHAIFLGEMANDFLLLLNNARRQCEVGGKFCSLGYLTRNCILFVHASRAKRFSAEWAEMSAMDNSHRIEKRTRVTTLSWSRHYLPDCHSLDYLYLLFTVHSKKFLFQPEKGFVGRLEWRWLERNMKKESTEKLIFNSKWKIAVERKRIPGCIRFLSFLSKKRL